MDLVLHNHNCIVWVILVIQLTVIIFFLKKCRGIYFFLNFPSSNKLNKEPKKKKEEGYIEVKELWRNFNKIA